MAEWTERGEKLESGEPARSSSRGSRGRAARLIPSITSESGAASGAPRRLRADPAATAVSTRSAAPAARRAAARSIRPIDALVALSNLSARALLISWFGMILGFGVVFWVACAIQSDGLTATGRHVDPDGSGFLAALYFSFVTATSVGYGDVVPIGFARVLAIAEAAAGLLLFGCLISKLISSRQEQLIEEIHRTTFEERLGRVRTNLHLVLSEIQATAGMCAEGGADSERIHTRVESTVMVFSGELRTIHDLLYRPQQLPDEAVLETILASLAAAMRELSDLLECMPPGRPQSSTMDANLEAISRLASEICGECVPRTYAPALQRWMDRIQALARSIPAGA